MTMKHLILGALVIGCGVGRLSAAETSPEELARKVREVFTANCYRCHGKDGANEGGFNFILDRQRLLQRRKVLPGDPAKSRLFRRISSPDDPMPPADEKPRPSDRDIALVKNWIEAGAPDFNAVAVKRTFITQAEVFRAMKADLEQVPERQRRFKRYFTLTHLYNAGLSEDELQSYRHGLSKLINSLSWGGKVVVPRSIDPARTIFRIDLRDYQWESQTWDRILDANPYGVLVDSEDAIACATGSGSRLPHVRGDWFVAAASRPPLYHDVLGLPSSEQELQKLLRIDVEQNIRQERIARAGFNGSGVSRNNRLIERHETNGVVYWRSYDFGGNIGKQNLFANPLGPGEGSSTFEQDGGEFIFSLPNGLQGYMLADAKGRRLDKGPTAIVSDPKRPDRAVENGLSCMGCHARGMIDKADQLREHVSRNSQAFNKADVELVQAIYPPRERFAALIRHDAKRFQEAVEKTGAPLSATEPIVALALRFEAEMDLPLVAAEAGCTPDVLRRTLDRSPRLAQLLGSLLVEGGTIQRSVFVDAFADLVRGLKLGTHLESRLARHDRLLRRGDLLRKQGEHGGAIEAFTAALEAVPASARAFHQRALAHHDRRDLDRAIADYTEAIRLDPRDAVAHHNRGFAHYDRQDLDRALADFDQALKLDPRYVTAWNNRGLTHQRKGNTERALADFAEAIRLDATVSGAWYNRAGVQLARGELQKAISDYTEAIRLDPKNASAFNNRGLARHRAGKHRQAVADFGEAIALKPRFVAAYHNRGLAHHALRDHDRAIADFSEAIRLDPQFARAWYHRADSHARKGNAAQAQRDRARALELDPDLDD
jgi:tetratricopeptide (TPR) repeat protein/mono/diheme cytochrome c family protein